MWAVLTFQTGDCRVVGSQCCSAFRGGRVVLEVSRLSARREGVRRQCVGHHDLSVMEPIRTTLWLGQINIFLLLLIVWDLGPGREESAPRNRGRHRRRREAHSGLLLGVPLHHSSMACVGDGRRDVRCDRCDRLRRDLQRCVQVLDRPLLSTANASDRTDAPSNQSVSGLIAQLTHTPTPSRVLVLVFSALAVCLGLGAAWMLTGTARNCSASP